MAEVNQKAAALSVKIAKREEKLAKIDEQILKLKREAKGVKKVIDDLNEDLRMVNLEQLAKALEQNGITTNDIAAAIADGSIKKTAPAAENAGKTEKEDTANEASGS